MTRVHITGEDVGFCRDSLKWLRPDGYNRLASPDSAAMQILAEVDHGVVVLPRPQTGRMDAGGFLSAASAHDDMWRRDRFVLLDGEPGRLPAEVERRRGAGRADARDAGRRSRCRHLGRSARGGRDRRSSTSSP